MKDPPSGRVPEQGLNWFLVALEAFGGGTPDLDSVLEVLGYVGIYGCKGYVGGPPGCSRGKGHAQGGRPHPHGQPGTPLTCTPSPSGGFPSEIKFSS